MDDETGGTLLDSPRRREAGLVGHGARIAWQVVVTGGGFALSYNSMNATDTRSELGTRFDDMTMLGAMPLSLRVRAAWAHVRIADVLRLAAGQINQPSLGLNRDSGLAAPPRAIIERCQRAGGHRSLNAALDGLVLAASAGARVVGVAQGAKAVPHGYTLPDGVRLFACSCNAV